MQNQSAASNDGPVNPDFSPPVQPPQQFVWPPPQWVAWIQQQPSPPQQGWSPTPTWPRPTDVAAASATAVVGPVSYMDFISRDLICMSLYELVWT